MVDPRHFALGVGASVLLSRWLDARASRFNPTERLRAIERAAGGRLGAVVLDTGSGRSFGWRADERFCHCSTFKLSLAALALREADAGRLDLTEMLAFSRADIVAYSPVVERNLALSRLPILALAEAVQVTSDNAAANVLMRRLGGPEAVTRFWREIGDSTSRLDGYEPAINVIPPGTEKNSTTPRAMAETVRRIVLGDVLSPSSRDRLRGWMATTQSGLKRIRAGVPASWRGYDKTGTGMREGVGNKTNDLAVLVPPRGRSPLVVTGYFETRPSLRRRGRRMKPSSRRSARLRWRGEPSVSQMVSITRAMAKQAAVKEDHRNPDFRIAERRCWPWLYWLPLHRPLINVGKIVFDRTARGYVEHKGF